MTNKILCTVTIENPKGEKKSYSVRKGLGFQALGLKEDTPIEFDCRRADCGICIVRICHGSEHLSLPTIAEADFLKAMRADPEERLSCQCRILGDVSLKVDL